MNVRQLVKKIILKQRLLPLYKLKQKHIGTLVTPNPVTLVCARENVRVPMVTSLT